MKNLLNKTLVTVSLISLTTFSTSTLAGNAEKSELSLEFANAPAVEAPAGGFMKASYNASATESTKGSFGGISALSSQTQRDRQELENARLGANPNTPNVLNDVVVYAVGLTDVQYRWGGENPDWGLDCSGLVRHVYERITGKSLPHNANAMTKVTQRIDMNQLQPGDLVFFNTRGFANSHVGIYVGNDRFIHAPNRRSKVQIASLSASNWSKRINSVRRVNLGEF